MEYNSAPGACVAAVVRTQRVGTASVMTASRRGLRVASESSSACPYASFEDSDGRPCSPAERKSELHDDTRRRWPHDKYENDRMSGGLVRGGLWAPWTLTASEADSRTTNRAGCGATALRDVGRVCTRSYDDYESDGSSFVLSREARSAVGGPAHLRRHSRVVSHDDGRKPRVDGCACGI